MDKKEDKEKLLCFVDIEVSKAKSFCIFCFLTKEESLKVNSIDEIKKHCKYVELCNNSKMIKYVKYIIDNKIPVIGFNIINFDIPIITLCSVHNVKNSEIYEITDKYINNKEEDNNNIRLIEIIERYIKESISDKNKEKKDDAILNLYKDIINRMIIIDLYLLNHWDNDSKRASLKWVACNLNSDNIVENPISIETEKLSEEELKTFVRYCVNDILETIRVYRYSLPLIEMREEVYKLYKTYLRKNIFYNYSNTAMASKMIELELKKRYNISIRDKINEKREKTKYVFNIKDELLFEPVKNYIQNDKTLYSKLKPYIESTLHRNVELNYDFTFDNSFDKENKTIISFGKGGAHGLMNNGIFFSDDEYTIIDFDVSGYYPEIVIQNNLYPINIGEVFIDLYKHLKTTRKQYPKGSPLNKAYKEAMNAVIGLSNTNPGSIVFDPSFFFKITINGQLQILILLDIIKKHIPLDLIMFNTDGCTIKIRKKDENMFYDAVKEWQKNFKYELEYTYYDRILFEHVNSYIAISKEKCDEEDKIIKYNEFIKDGYKYKVKTKGNMIPYKEDMELHKNTGLRIIPLCVYNYFVHNIPVMQTIIENKDINMYTDMVRINKNTEIIYYDEETNRYVKYNGKVLRFIYPKSKENAKIYYRNGKNGKTLLSKKHPYITECNNINNVKIEDLDLQYYVSMASSMINQLFIVKHKNLFSV